MPDTRQRFVSVKEAALILHLSESDVRRRVKRGELTAETYQRPQGTVIRVLVDVPEDESDTRQVDATPKADTLQTLRELSNTLDNMIATLSHAQHVSDRRAERIAELERENGRLEAEWTAESRRNTQLWEQLLLRRRPWWRRWLRLD